MPGTQYYKKSQRVEAMQFTGSNHEEMIAFSPVLSIRASDGALMFMGSTEILPQWWVFMDSDSLEWYYSNDFEKYYSRTP
jgi:hypothetical protein